MPNIYITADICLSFFYHVSDSELSSQGIREHTGLNSNVCKSWELHPHLNLIEGTFGHLHVQVEIYSFCEANVSR